MAKGRKTVRTDRAREKFLAQLRLSPNVSAAARAGGFGRNAAYEWRKDDEEFAAAWDEALDEAIDNLEATAYERASTTSDRLAEVLLKAHRPDKYVEKRLLEHTGKDGGPIQTKVDLTKVSDAGLEALREIASNAIVQND